jgi:hypothetical protein
MDFALFHYVGIGKVVKLQIWLWKIHEREDSRCVQDLASCTIPNYGQIPGVATRVI